MLNYLVRVELCNAGSEEYEELHARMEVLGMKKMIVFPDGKNYAMPKGTYFGHSRLDVDTLRDCVKILSDQLTLKEAASIFVCCAGDYGWSAALRPA